MQLTFKQYDIAKTLRANYDYIEKLAAIKFIKSIFGTTASLKDIIIAYNSLEY
jgi:hypothetical protein